MKVSFLQAGNREGIFKVGYKKRGFTLIELLVVIAIIAILAAILFPVFAAAKNRAKVSTCASNMRQMYTALVMYCDSYDGRIPPSYKINYPAYAKKTKMTDIPDVNTIQYKLMKYVPMNQGSANNVFKCPSDVVIPPMKNGVYDTVLMEKSILPMTYATFGTSYQWRLGNKDDKGTYNYIIAQGDLTPAEKELLLSGKVLSTFSSPSKISAARDAATWHAYGDRIKQDNLGEYDPQAGGNVLYLDGHVLFAHGGEFTGGIY